MAIGAKRSQRRSSAIGSSTTEFSPTVAQTQRRRPPGRLGGLTAPTAIKRVDS
jgi:hypothetical protein